MNIGAKIDALKARVIAKASARMPDRCYQQPVNTSQTSDALGFPNEAQADSGDQIYCRMDGVAVKRQVELENGQLSSVMANRMVLLTKRPISNTDVVVQAGDRLRVLARGTRPERLMRIVGVGEREGVTIEVYGVVVTN